MNGLGQRMRERAKELGLPDATVAERLGLSQQRYHNYISDQTEPDFQTFVRICRALAIEPTVLLGFSAEPHASEETTLQARINAAASTMDTQTLRITAAVVDALAKEASREPTTTKRRVLKDKEVG